MILDRHRPLLALVFLILPACAPTPGGSGAAPVAPIVGPEIHWDVEPSGKAIVSVVNLDPGDLATLRDPDWSQDRLAGIFSVEVRRPEPSNSPRPRMLGSYQVDDSAIRFRPLYPLDYGVDYRAVFEPQRVPGRAKGPFARVMADLVRVAPPSKPTVVSGVDPTGDVLPENLLKLYVQFSAPMSRGSAYEHVRLLDDAGKAIDLPFLELGEELWDGSMTRLTLLFDPGRVKRGLKPREESGPILESGRSYTFVVDPSWADAAGQPLSAEFRKPFRAGPVDETQPDPKTWTIEPPAVGSLTPLTITFPESLDRAMLEHAIGVLDEAGVAISCRLEIDADAKRVRFVPESPWKSGDHRIVVDTSLEDLCGNSVRRQFEVDETRPISAGPESQTVAIPFRPL